MRWIQPLATSARAAVVWTEAGEWGAVMWTIRSEWRALRFICGRNRAYQEKRDPERYFLPDVVCDAVTVRTERLPLETVGKKYPFSGFLRFFWNWNEKEQQISIL